MSDGAILHGQQFDPVSGIVRRFTEQAVDYTGADTARVTGAEGSAAIDLTPIDRAAAKKRTYDLSAIQTALTAVSYSYPFRLKKIDLPLELTGITVVKNSTNGSGVGNHPVGQQAFSIVSGSGSLSPRSSAEGTAAVSFELAPVFKRVPTTNLSAIAYGVHVIGPTITEAAVRTAVGVLAGATVNAWPVFIEAKESFVLSGQQVSVQAKAATTASISVGRTGTGEEAVTTVLMAAYEYGDDFSKSNGISQRVVELPWCIHGTISLSPSEATETVTATVKANTPAILSAVPAIFNEPSPVEATATARVTPTSISATSPSSIPTSGLYLYDYNIEDIGYGVFRVVAIVINMSIYA